MEQGRRRPPATDEQVRMVRDTLRGMQEHTAEIDALDSQRPEVSTTPKVLLGSIVTIEYPDRQKTIRIALVNDKSEYKGDQDITPVELNVPIAVAIIGRQAGDEMINFNGQNIRIISVINLETPKSPESQ